MKTKLGIVGCGFLGNIVADAWKKGLLPDYELVGVTSRTRASAEKTAANVGCSVCEDVDALLALEPEYIVEAASVESVRAMAIPVLKRHLEMPGAVWQPERCASMRFLSRCYLSMGDRRQGMVWALRAIAEAPELREPWVQAQEAAYAAEDWEGVVYYGRRAVDITERSGFYINEDRAWGAYPWDAMAYACYRIGDLRAAGAYGEQALLEEPDNPRLLKNMRFYTGAPAGTQRSGSCGERTGAQAHGVGAEVPLGCNLGKAVTFSPEVPNYPAKYCEIPTSLRSSE